MLQGPGLDGQLRHFEKPWASTAVMFLAMALTLPAAALVRRARAWARRMDAAAAGSEVQAPLLAQQSGGSMASSVASSTVWGWGTPPALQAPAPGPPSKQALALVLVPTAFDLISAWMLNVGLLSITGAAEAAASRGTCNSCCRNPAINSCHLQLPCTASMYMMLRGSEVLFAALLSRLWLGRRLNRWHLAGLGTCTVRLVGCLHHWHCVPSSQTAPHPTRAPVCLCARPALRSLALLAFLTLATLSSRRKPSWLRCWAC